MPVSGPWGFGPNTAVKLNMMPIPETADIAVTFMVSLRELMSVRHNAMAQDIARRAQDALTQHLVTFLDSQEFDLEVKAAVRAELKEQVRKSLIDRVDEMVEDMLT
jgi:hypothetical protein